MLPSDATIVVDRLLTQAIRQPLNIKTNIDLAEAALASGRESHALPLLETAAVQHQTSASLWQWVGLLHRSIDQHEAAMVAFGRAASIAPNDPLIQHSLARTTLESGLPAISAFDVAVRLAPNNAAVLLGRAAALLAGGEAGLALNEIDAVLVKNPGWRAGHETAARLRWVSGQREMFLASLDTALRKHPRDHVLWRIMLDLLMQAEQYEAVLETVSRACLEIGEQDFLFAQKAAANAELGQFEQADADYARLNICDDDKSFIVRRMRHLLRTGRVCEAVQYAESKIGGEANNLIWPYLGTAWRLLKDSRWEWYEGDPALIREYDIGASLPSLDELAAVLRQLHKTVHQPLDQTIRGGTQTDGNLFLRLNAPIRALRATIIDAVHDYLNQLGPIQTAHPTLSHQRIWPVRFAGAWSVRLMSSGFHVRHTHPSGWLSSVFYVTLPECVEHTDRQDGWLVLGSPPHELGTGLDPIRVIQPKIGRLVLFPSTMWHGTNPFMHGERMTVAFDIAAPKTGHLI